MIVREEFDPFGQVDEGAVITACSWLGCVVFGFVGLWCPLGGSGKCRLDRGEVEVDDLENRMSCSA